nr:N-acetylmuramoyl-L-alanine amidase [uncultured Carboxylicivirga sp.]
MSFKEKYTITQLLLTSGSKRRRGISMSPGVKFIVAHDTGNPKSTARNNRDYYERTRNEVSASAHIFVDDKEIIECIPALTSASPEKAWHVLYNVPNDNQLFGYNANDAAIGVEYCYGSNINADEAYRKYIWVMAKICHAYNLDPAKSIVGHCFLDPARKTDPVTGLLKSRRTYDQLLKDVVTEFNECVGKQIDEYKLVKEKGEVKTTSRLNIRAGKPTTKAPVHRTVDANTILTYTHYTLDGESVNGNSKWYKDEEGNYYWSGCVRNKKDEELLDLDSKSLSKELVTTISESPYYFKDFVNDDQNTLIRNFDLNQLLDVDEAIKRNDGDGVNVGIMDHPFEDIFEIFSDRVESILNGGDVQSFHGIQMASIIGAKYTSNPEYKSICSKCKLISLPVVIEGRKDPQFFIDVIDKILSQFEPGNIIINASLSVKKDDISLLESHFLKLSEKYIVIASAGQDNELLNDNEIQWPARLDNVLSVGSISKSFFEANPNPSFNSRLDILLPENRYPAFNYKVNPKYKSVAGDSSATAIITGLSTLLTNKYGNIGKSRLLELIKEQSVGYKEADLSVIKPIKPLL